MQIRKYDESWPYIELFTSIRANDQQAKLERSPLFHDIGVRLEKLAKDYTRISFSPPVDVARPGSILQGGVLANLVDVAAGQALRTTLKLDHDAVTIHLDTKYFRPVYEERVSAEARVVRKGRNLAHIEVAVKNEAGVLVARGWCVLKVTRRIATDLPEPGFTRMNCEGLQGELNI